jgi:DNA-binding response OmpR family regulator
MKYKRYAGYGSSTPAVVIATPFTRDREYLRDIVRQSGFSPVEVLTYRDALAAIGIHGPAAIVCDESLSWRDIIGHLADDSQPPRIVIVTADHDQAVFAEVLNLGAYDVLTKPFSSRETEWVICSACSRSTGGSPGKRPPSREEHTDLPRIASV